MHKPLRGDIVDAFPIILATITAIRRILRSGTLHELEAEI